MHRVLLVGADLSLLHTRSMVVEKTGASVVSAMPEQAFPLLDSTAFDLLVLCHSTPDCDVHQLCRAARAHAIKILLIESPNTHYLATADVHDRFQLEDGPKLLIRTVNHLLAPSSPGELTPAARLFPFVQASEPASRRKPSPPSALTQPQRDAPRASVSGEAKSYNTIPATSA